MPQPKLSEEARQDMDELYVFGALNYGLAHTDRYAHGLDAALKLLGDRPLMARERREVRPPVRLLRYEAHNIFYDTDGKRVTILRILHHSADWMHSL